MRLFTCTCFLRFTALAAALFAMTALTACEDDPTDLQRDAGQTGSAGSSGGDDAGAN